MSKRQKEPEVVAMKQPPAKPATMTALGGSKSDDWNMRLAQDTLNTLWLKNSDAATKDKQYQAAFAGLIGIGPKDELEGMLAGQLLATHHAAMECFRRAMIGKQTFEGRRESLNQTNKLSRTYVSLLDALNSHRGKGQQKVTVEHVHVHSGGQAIVGNVNGPGGGAATNRKEQAHAKQIGHAPEPPMWSANEERDAMPVASDEERPMLDARRAITWCTEE